MLDVCIEVADIFFDALSIRLATYLLKRYGHWHEQLACDAVVACVEHAGVQLLLSLSVWLRF